MEYLRDGRLDKKWEIGQQIKWEIWIQLQEGGRNWEIGEKYALGAGRLAERKVGDWEIQTPPPLSSMPIEGIIFCIVRYRVY